jgi:RimJ/RimL family protein N-acetyltransferase
MIPITSGQSWYASLTEADRDRLVAHWMRLPEDCIRRRFMRAMGPAALRTHADEVFAGDARAIGWFHEGILRGVAELFPLRGGVGEAAFTVEPEFRRRGVGKGLLRRVLRRARNLGLQRVEVMTTRENTAMVRLARACGGELRYDGREVTGVFDLEPATPVSLAHEMAEEGAARSAELADRAVRFAAGLLPAARPAA